MTLRSVKNNSTYFSQLEETSTSDDVIVEEDDDADLNELKALRNTLQQTKYDHDKRKDQIIVSWKIHSRCWFEKTLYINIHCYVKLNLLIG